MLSHTVLSEAEIAVSGYAHICNMTLVKDLTQAIPNKEIEHESGFSEFLGEQTSGHFVRRGDTSPFVSKVLK
jgi:ferritin-like protein